MEGKNGLKSHDIPVRTVMSQDPMVINDDETIMDAAKRMAESNIGSLVVLDDEENLTGIVTEMDIVKKVTAENREPKKVTVEEIMSTPVHTIEGGRPIQEGAELMAEEDIRRLPVISEGEMIGIITENDVLEISPTLIDITREYKKIHEPEDIERYKEPLKKETSGYCESCGVYSDSLVSKNGEFLCSECSNN